MPITQPKIHTKITAVYRRRIGQRELEIHVPFQLDSFPADRPITDINGKIYFVNHLRAESITLEHYNAEVGCL